MTELINSIPDTVWAALLGSILTLAGVVLTNRHHLRVHRDQLKHTATENERKRKFEVRVEAYLAAAEDMAEANRILGGLNTLDFAKTDPSSYLSGFIGADHAIRGLLDFGFLCPVVTVQAGIEKGVFTWLDFRRWFYEFFGALGLDLKGPYVCPHRYTHRCSCEKPNPTLYDQAASEFGLALQRSFVIGDSTQDVQAAEGFAGTGCLVNTGWPITEEGRESASFVGDSIVDAAKWILQQESSR